MKKIPRLIDHFRHTFYYAIHIPTREILDVPESPKVFYLLDYAE